jgi:glycosyltransferase involved in cell wall biosynthesis
MLSFYFAPSYSGSAVQARNLCRHLAAHGIEPMVVSANLTGGAAVDNVDGIPVFRLPVTRGERGRIRSFGVSLVRFLLRQRRSIDVIHAHGGLQHGVCSVVGRALGKKTILKIAMANSDIAFERQGRLAGRINRFFVRQFDRYIATSSEVRDECLARGLDPGRVLLVPNGVDTDRFHPAASADEKRQIRSRLGLPPGPIACFVGVIDARKNVDGILRVWRDVKRAGAHGQLLLIGPETEGGRGPRTAFAEELHRFVAAEGLADSVIFAGAQEQVGEYLRAADLFFFPSRREGMPNVVLEAMASGLACIVSAIGGSVDLVQHGKSGYVFKLDDEAGMADCLTRLLGNPAHVADLGQAARHRAETEFSLRATARTYADLYRDLLRG